jgi:hypothetical protein
MIQLNWYIVLASGVVPLIVGALWYSPMGFANAWMKENGFTEDDLKGSNMALIFGLTLLFGIMLAVGVMPYVIHQMHLYSMLQHQEALIQDANSTLSVTLKGLMDQYGQEFRTFKHGALHGTIASLFIVLPVLAINALFERRSRKYVLLHLGYWTITLALMGGIISGFA